MDSVRAVALAKQLVGQSVEGWRITSLIDHGKSAAVFRATKGRKLAAVKVFDSELIERYGDKTQLARIEREKALIDKRHPHIVEIHGGGYDKVNDLYYVIMGLVRGENLRRALKKIPLSSIPRIMEQLSSAALFLENLNLVHRDIKPENIAINSKFTKITLLDLGVVRPIGVSDITDPAGILAFVGTLQYSSPEFLLRKEVDNLDGWRALTFYQLGGVLHDLIMRRPLFEEFANPFARLVNAVQHEHPAITSSEVDSHWVQLARKALVKDPTVRLQMVSWDLFKASAAAKPEGSARDRVAEQVALMRTGRSEIQDRAAEGQSRTPAQIRSSVIGQLKASARSVRNAVPQLPPLHQSVDPSDQSVLFVRFEPSPDLGFPMALCIKLSVEILDSKAEAIVCRGQAVFAPQTVQPKSECVHVWFSGVLDAAALQSSFENLFFESMEWYLERVREGTDTEMTFKSP